MLKIKICFEGKSKTGKHEMRCAEVSQDQMLMISGRSSGDQCQVSSVTTLSHDSCSVMS